MPLAVLTAGVDVAYGGKRATLALELEPAAAERLLELTAEDRDRLRDWLRADVELALGLVAPAPVDA